MTRSISIGDSLMILTRTYISKCSLPDRDQHSKHAPLATQWGGADVGCKFSLAFHIVTGLGTGYFST